MSMDVDPAATATVGQSIRPITSRGEEVSTRLRAGEVQSGLTVLRGAPTLGADRAAGEAPEPMKLSVSLITYNHEGFISQAIESVLAQRVTFDWELLIGDDCSTDGTPEIIRRFHRRYPNLIRPILRSVNVVAKRNFLETFKACRGEYISLLDGDDYWTSDDKLQTQVDFLDSHPQCSMCFHSAEILMPDGRLIPDSLVNQELCRQRHLELGDVIGSLPCRTGSAVLRRSSISELPEWLYTLKMCDWPVFALAAAGGQLGYVDEIMSVYRIHEQGVWSRLEPREQLKELIRMFQRLNAHFDFAFDNIVSESLCRSAYTLVGSQSKGLGPWIEGAGERSESADGCQLRAGVAESGEVLRTLEAELRVRTAERDAVALEFHRKVCDQQAELEAAMTDLAAIHQSKAWQVMTRYWALRDRLRQLALSVGRHGRA